VVLEDERHQTQLREKKINELELARELLEGCNVAVPPFDSQTHVKAVDMATALRAEAVTVEVCDPTLEDYRDAERRAALHLPPQSPATSSDEMRDLVIWALALRLAKIDGQAMLISRDETHSDKWGKAEAAAAGLYRARDFDEASETLGLVTPAGTLAREIIKPMLDALEMAGLPFPKELSRIRLSAVTFTTDRDGHVGASVDFAAKAPRDLTGVMKVFQATPTSIQANLSSLSIDGKPRNPPTITVTAAGALPSSASPVGERLADLKQLIEGA
jgi:hypothetical protein